MTRRTTRRSCLSGVCHGPCRPNWAMAALNQQSLAQYVTDLFEKRLEELERKGMLPKGK